MKLSTGGTFTENLASYNYVEFCHRWVGLGNVEECMQDITEYEQIKGNKKSVVDIINPNRVIGIQRPIPDWVKNKVDGIIMRLGEKL